jgi:hypothetical protein
MAEAKIPGGYILLSRKIIDSEIWNKPPLYIKVWAYLLIKAQHSEYKQLQRGQLWTSIPEIQEECSYKVGYRTVTPTYKEVRDVLDFLRNTSNGNILRDPSEGNTKGTTKGTMIGTTKGTHGILVNIDNYCFYQDPKNYERHDEGQDEGNAKDERRAGQGHNINKNDKNDKNDNNDKKEEVIIMSPIEAEYIAIISAIQNYPLDREVDIKYFHELESRYPKVDVIEMVKDYAAYKLDNPLKPKANPRSQLNTQCKKCMEWGKCLKKQGGMNDGKHEGSSQGSSGFYNRGLD